MEIINLTPEKGTLEGTEYNLGEIDYASSITFKLLFKDKVHLRTKFGCGSCTKGEAKQKDKDVELTIEYTPFRGGGKGSFQKGVTEYYLGGETKITFKGTGIDRDLNAAINIKNTGIKIPKVTVEEKRITSPMKQ